MESLLKISKSQLIDVSCGVSLTLSTSSESPAPTLTIPVTIEMAATTAALAAVIPPALDADPLDPLDPPDSLEDFSEVSFSFCSSLRRFSFFSGDLFSSLEEGLSQLSLEHLSILPITR